MNNGKLYSESNALQKRDAKQIIEEFSHLFKWKSDGTETLLDIGTGAGDVLVEYLLPKMPEHFAQLVGVDISKEMIKYASEMYQNEFLKFYKVDIESDFLTPKRNDQSTCPLKPESFDFITSFYCLHWIQNQRQAFTNIYKMLKPNGSCLLAFLISNPIYDVYLSLSRMKKYQKYMHDVEKYISPYHFDEKPLKVLKALFYDVGFQTFNIEIRDQLFIFDDVAVLKYAVKSVNPFTSRMPENLQNDFLNDYIQKVDELNLIRKNKIYSPYKLLVAVANK